ncbi:MAG: hypothetical protein AAF745_11105, partial [Planctomycetota bacterium]
MTTGDQPTDSSVATDHSIDADRPDSALPNQSPESGPVAEATTTTETPATVESIASPPKSASRKAPLPRLGPGPLAARGLGVAKPKSPEGVSTDNLGPEAGKQSLVKGNSKRKPGSPASPSLTSTAASESAPPQEKKARSKGKAYPRPRLAGEKESTGEKIVVPKREKIAVPNLRESLPEDLEAELAASLEGSDLESYLGGTAGLPDRREQLGEGTRVHAQVIKLHDDSVFVSLGGPDEGVIPLEQFTESEPTAGQSIEVIVRGLNREDGLYACTLPGSAIEVSDWGDIDEGSVVEAVVT